MHVLAIDPGTDLSAYVVYDTAARRLLAFAKVPNRMLLQTVRDPGSAWCGAKVMVVEKIASYGFAVGQEVFDTCVMSGRVAEAWETRGSGCEAVWLPRLAVKLALLHSAKGNDAAIRQALMKLVGPPGTKAAPGPTYGLARDTWQALAVAVAYQLRERLWIRRAG